MNEIIFQVRGVLMFFVSTWLVRQCVLVCFLTCLLGSAFCPGSDDDSDSDIELSDESYLVQTLEHDGQEWRLEFENIKPPYPEIGTLGKDLPWEKIPKNFEKLTNTIAFREEYGQKAWPKCFKTFLESIDETTYAQNKDFFYLLEKHYRLSFPNKWLATQYRETILEQCAHQENRKETVQVLEARFLYYYTKCYDQKKSFQRWTTQLALSHVYDINKSGSDIVNEASESYLWRTYMELSAPLQKSGMSAKELLINSMKTNALLVHSGESF